MITSAVLAAAAAVLRLLRSALPGGSVPWLASTSGFGAWWGDKLGPLNPVFPVTELVTFLTFMLTVYLPAVIVYTVAKWAYRHFPMLGKG